MNFFFLQINASQQQQTLQRTPKFDLKGPVYGYRSLSNGSRAVGAPSVPTVDKSSSLFAGGEDDPPLLMSSIDEVTTQVMDSVIDCLGWSNFDSGILTDFLDTY